MRLFEQKILHAEKLCFSFESFDPYIIITIWIQIVCFSEKNLALSSYVVFLENQLYFCLLFGTIKIVSLIKFFF